MNRKHYRAIAEIVRCIGNTYRGNYIHKLLANKLANYFAIDNPRFDRGKFLKVCEL